MLWKRDDFKCDHFRGSGSSPIIHGNLLILTFDGADLQYMAALDKRTGKTVTKKNSKGNVIVKTNRACRAHSSRRLLAPAASWKGAE